MQVHRADRRHRAVRLQHHGHVLPLGCRNRDRGWPLLAGTCWLGRLGAVMGHVPADGTGSGDCSDQNGEEDFFIVR
jgi:hypothetical protein